MAAKHSKYPQKHLELFVIVMSIFENSLCFKQSLFPQPKNYIAHLAAPLALQHTAHRQQKSVYQVSLVELL